MQSIRSKKKYLNFLALLALIGCSNGEVRQSIDEASYRSSGIEQFFLPELPHWANHSASGQCFKSTSFQYLDFSKINTTYQLNYNEILELQGQYNLRREDYFRSTAYRFLKPVEEASFFANTLEQVRAGIRLFKLPTVPEVEIVWLEGFLQGNRLQELKTMAAEGKFDEVPPVLFSSCLSRQSLIQWIAENELEAVGFYLLSAEWLSPYDSEIVMKAGLRVEFLRLVSPGVKVRMQPPTPIPTEIILK